METYEIRIMRLDGSPGLITESKYLNADAAITAGKLLSRGRRFEVWNRDCCVYDVRPQIAHPPPRRSA
jgi:hypothetical protein